MTKQEKIQEVWINEIGIDTYEADVKGFVDDDGWVDIKFYLLKDNYSQSRPIREGFSPTSFLRRPESLQGIEKNNGWIKIESGDDLIVEDGYYAVYNTRWKNDEISLIQVTSPYNNFDKSITHYQPIIIPQQPIY